MQHTCEAFVPSGQHLTHRQSVDYRHVAFDNGGALNIASRLSLQAIPFQALGRRHSVWHSWHVNAGPGEHPGHLQALTGRCHAGGENGFSQAIELASDTLSNVKFVQEKRLISKFFDEISQVPLLSTSCLACLTSYLSPTHTRLAMLYAQAFCITSQALALVVQQAALSTPDAAAS